MKEAATFLLLVVNDGSIWTCAWYSSKTQFNKVFLLAERKDCDQYSTSKKSTPGTRCAPSSISLHLSLPLSLESHLGKEHLDRRIVQIQILLSQPCESLLSTSTLFLWKSSPPDHPKKRCPELFVTYWLIDISGGPVTYRLDYLPIQRVLILHQKRKFNSSMNSSVVRKQPPHI